MYPHLLHIYGPIWIQTYGVMIALGFFAFLFLSINHPIRKKYLTQEQYLNLLFIGLASGIIGGRLLYIIANPGQFTDNWLEALYPWVGGFFVLGSILGVIITVPLYLRFTKTPILPIMDLASLYAPVLQAIARLGCLGAGCCYGAAASTLWWAITFVHPDSSAPCNVALHPTQLYISLASLLIFFILRISTKKTLSHPGCLLFLYLILENISRITIDFWRGDREPFVASLLRGSIQLSQAQLYALITLAIAGCGFAVMWFKKSVIKK